MCMHMIYGLPPALKIMPEEKFIHSFRMISLMSPTESWVAKWQRIGMYANGSSSVGLVV